MASLNSRQRIAVRFGLLAGLGTLALVGAWVVRTIPPEGSGLYPPCLLHATTGLHCPGCGATRGLHAMLNGEVGQAFAYNPVAPLLVPVFALLIGASIRQAVAGTRPRILNVSKWWYVGSVGLLVAFFALRNIPVYPFTLLVPHKI